MAEGRRHDDDAGLTSAAWISYALTIMPLVLFEQYAALPGALVACAAAHLLLSKTNDRPW